MKTFIFILLAFLSINSFSQVKPLYDWSYDSTTRQIGDTGYLFVPGYLPYYTADATVTYKMWNNVKQLFDDAHYDLTCVSYYIRSTLEDTITILTNRINNKVNGINNRLNRIDSLLSNLPNHVDTVYVKTETTYITQKDDNILFKTLTYLFIAIFLILVIDKIWYQWKTKL